MKTRIDRPREQILAVIFTDEYKFNRFGSEGRPYIRRRIEEELNNKCIKFTINGKGGSVIV